MYMLDKRVSLFMFLLTFASQNSSSELLTIIDYLRNRMNFDHILEKLL